jgi:hypothetical protein|nr:hypothetical protein [Pseudoflavonifractor sp. BIOML-A9]
MSETTEAAALLSPPDSVCPAAASVLVVLSIPFKEVVNEPACHFTHSLSAHMILDDLRSSSRGGIKMHFIKFLRRVSPLFALVAVLSFLPAAASATLAEGPCGPSATWSLSTQPSAPNVLALNISGTGAITSNPWLEIGESLGRTGFNVTIEEGITEIGASSRSGSLPTGPLQEM